MAIRGQRFTLDPDADNFTFDVHENDDNEEDRDTFDFVKHIKERNPTGIPPPPKPKATKNGFPQPRSRSNVAAQKPLQQEKRKDNLGLEARSSSKYGPSDRAIVNQISRKYGLDLKSKERQEISDENKRRIAQMSTEDIEEARSEIMTSLSPAFIEKFLKRANIDEDKQGQTWQDDEVQMIAPAGTETSEDIGKKRVTIAPDVPEQDRVLRVDQTDVPVPQPTASPSEIQPQFVQVPPSIHFPVPPRNPDDYVVLDPNSPSFLGDLKKHYFPSLPDDPSGLAWLQDPTEEESEASPYAPTQTRYASSDIRFDFAGRLVPPRESRDVPMSEGLHHHGEAPESAGYTIPELGILARSALPNQRCVAYQVLGRVLYRLGHGDFGLRGSELEQGLWACVEKERPIEVIMSEANRGGGHMSAKAYATEALWLWKKGGGGDRGVLRPGETIAK